MAQARNSQEAVSAAVHVPLGKSEHAAMARAAKQRGFANVGDYLTQLHRQASGNGDVPEQSSAESNSGDVSDNLRLYYETSLGRLLLGDARLHLRAAPARSIDLIMTSPPFGLLRKKSYGNEDAHRYCQWFRTFADEFQRVLKKSGSLVIDIGGAWRPGTPTRSLYHFELLMMLCEDYGFHLCQEHYWWNPSKLPTPAEWVNIRRVRVKDAVNCIWWLSPTPWPKASNRRVLAPYSKAMRDLMKHGYQAKLRPSGHQISAKFGKDNGGAVPPNLLAVANTESNGRYQDYCREKGYPIHPARFPEELPEYFIRLLTDRGDAVLDPFAGSCVTGAVAERLQRRWTCCELNEDYLKGALARFETPCPGDSEDLIPAALESPRSKRGRNATYSISAPCSVPVADGDAPLVQDGGLRRPSRDKPAAPDHGA